MNTTPLQTCALVVLAYWVCLGIYYSRRRRSRSSEQGENEFIDDTRLNLQFEDTVDVRWILWAILPPVICLSWVIVRG
jgi:hypothetical protein